MFKNKPLAAYHNGRLQGFCNVFGFISLYTIASEEVDAASSRNWQHVTINK